SRETAPCGIEASRRRSFFAVADSSMCHLHAVFRSPWVGRLRRWSGSPPADSMSSDLGLFSVALQFEPGNRGIAFSSKRSEARSSHRHHRSSSSRPTLHNRQKFPASPRNFVTLADKHSNLYLAIRRIPAEYSPYASMRSAVARAAEDQTFRGPCRPRVDFERPSTEFQRSSERAEH